MFPRVKIFDHSNDEKPVSIEVDVIDKTHDINEPSIVVTSLYEEYNELDEYVGHDDIGMKIEVCLTYEEAEVLILRLQQSLNELVAKSYEQQRAK